MFILLILFKKNLLLSDCGIEQVQLVPIGFIKYTHFYLNCELPSLSAHYID